MPSFSYTAVDQSGNRVQGSLDSPDKVTASRHLAGRGLTPISLRPSGNSESAKPSRKPSPPARSPRPSAASGPYKPASGSYRQPVSNHPGAKSKTPVSGKSFRRFLTLALRLHEGGYSIGDTVKVLRSRLTDPVDQGFAETVWEEISEGRGFSDALESAGAPIPPSLLQMIRAGEATGNLAPVLRDLLNYLQNLDAVRKEVVGSIVYPAFLVTFTLAVGGFLVGYMMPQIQGMVTSMGSEVSFFNRLLSTLTESIVAGFPVALITLALVTVAVTMLRRRENGRLATDRIALRLPAVGSIFRLFDLYRLCSLLASLMRNGVSTAEALILTEPAVRNGVLRAGFAATREAVFEGAPVSRTLVHHGLLDAVEGDLLGASEAGGDLASGFGDLASDFRDSLTRSTKVLVNAIAAAAMAFAFILVALVALAMVSSIFEVSKNLQF